MGKREKCDRQIMRKEAGSPSQRSRGIKCIDTNGSQIDVIRIKCFQIFFPLGKSANNVHQGQWIIVRSHTELMVFL
jgi:hypothetical protein